LIYFTWFLGHRIKDLYVHYLCKLLTYGHQICKVSASYMCALIDRFTSGLTYFSKSQGSKCKIKFWVNQGVTNRNHYTPRPAILRAQTY